MWDKLYPMTDPPNYEPTADQSVAAQSEAASQTALEFAYDFLSQGDGQNVLFAPLFNYANGNLDATTRDDDASTRRDGALRWRSALRRESATHQCRPSCSHHWTRDRSRGETLPLEWTVKRMTSDTAELYGLGDRGGRS